jgi:hypothetical protein
MKQTAVEWLFAHLLPFLEFSDPKEREHFRKCLAEAKAMEKEQMDKVAGDWWNEGASYMHDGKRKYESFEQYYNETYGGDK